LSQQIPIFLQLKNGYLLLLRLPLKIFAVREGFAAQILLGDLQDCNHCPFASQTVFYFQLLTQACVLVRPENKKPSRIQREGNGCSLAVREGFDPPRRNSLTCTPV
jgi:hypothetical protein